MVLVCISIRIIVSNWSYSSCTFVFVKASRIIRFAAALRRPASAISADYGGNSAPVDSAANADPKHGP